MKLINFPAKIYRKLQFMSQKVSHKNAGESKRNDYLKQHANPKLHLGSGPIYLEGWLNCDYEQRHPQAVFIDITQRLPFPDDTFSFAYINHTIEHFLPSDGYNILKELYRVLKKGGALRVGYPSLEGYARLHNTAFAFNASSFHPELSLIDGEVMKDKCICTNDMFYNHGHRFHYNTETMSSLLKRMGFKKVFEEAYMESVYPELKGLEMHDWWLKQPGEVPENRDIIKTVSTYITAVKE